MHLTENKKWIRSAIKQSSMVSSSAGLSSVYVSFMPRTLLKTYVTSDYHTKDCTLDSLLGSRNKSVLVKVKLLRNYEYYRKSAKQDDKLTDSDYSRSETSASASVV